jgi:hypothetical protein
MSSPELERKSTGSTKLTRRAGRAGSTGLWVENIFFQTAPVGEYTFYANQFAYFYGRMDDWTLTVTIGGIVVFTESGAGTSEIFTYMFVTRLKVRLAMPSQVE